MWMLRGTLPAAAAALDDGTHDAASTALALCDMHAGARAMDRVLLIEDHDGARVATAVEDRGGLRLLLPLRCVLCHQHAYPDSTRLALHPRGAAANAAVYRVPPLDEMCAEHALCMVAHADDTWCLELDADGGVTACPIEEFIPPDAL